MSLPQYVDELCIFVFLFPHINCGFFIRIELVDQITDYFSDDQETEKNQHWHVVIVIICESSGYCMISDLMLAIILQEIDFGAEDLRATEHPESDCTVNEWCKLDQLKGLSV